MPPMRSIPIKTERTHEENQERAYIAASRRSDRSLEARVESARRASEIHKKRTGRSLRVTEEDVQNEEMYEEEDDDLPRRFQGIPQHLRTQDEEYNKRLHAYLVHTMAMRQAVGNAQQYGRSYSGFGQQMFSPPSQTGMGNGMMRPQQQNPQMYQRHQPYPSTNAPQMQMGQHSRSASVSNASGAGISPKSNMSPTLLQAEEARRKSMPTPNSGTPENSEPVKQEQKSFSSPALKTETITPRIQSNFSNLQINSPSALTAPHSLSQDVYPGVGGNYAKIFTNELPNNVQMMGFSPTGSSSMGNNDFGATTFGYNMSTPSNEGLKRPQESYTGSRALDVTLPDMSNFSSSQGSNTQLKYSAPSQRSHNQSFESQGLDNDAQKHNTFEDSNYETEFGDSLFDDTSYDAYSNPLFDIPGGSHDGLNVGFDSSPVKDEF